MKICIYKTCVRACVRAGMKEKKEKGKEEEGTMNSSSSGSAPTHVETTTSLWRTSFSRRISSNKHVSSGGAPTWRENSLICYNRILLKTVINNCILVKKKIVVVLGVEKQLKVIWGVNNYLLTFDVGLEETRVVRVRGDFGFDERRGVVVVLNFWCDGDVRVGFGFVAGGDGDGGGEKLVGSEHWSPGGGGH